MKFQLTIVLLLAASCFATKARYDNYKLYSLQLKTEEQAKMVVELEHSTDAYDFWTGASLSQDTDVMVPPHKFGEFEDFLDRFNIDFHIKVENIQELVDQQDPELMVEKSEAIGNTLVWDRFHNPTEIHNFGQAHVASSRYLNSHIIGTSHLGQPIIVYDYSEKSGNRAIFMECGMHAREWTAVSSCTWFLNELITSNDAAIRDIAHNIDWHFVLIANPDGFAFTHSNTRLWRKTRQPWGSCIGTDPNRNFDFFWMSGGASNNPCSDTYAGPSPFSEPETAAIRDYYGTIANRCTMYVSIHAFGHYLLMPYGHVRDNSTNWVHMMSVGTAAGDAIRGLDGSDYLVGSTFNVLYAASGSSPDWAFGRYNTPLTYTYEVAPMRGTSNGFVMNPAQIMPNNRAIGTGIRAMIVRARQLGYFPS